MRSYLFRRWYNIPLIIWLGIALFALLGVWALFIRPRPAPLAQPHSTEQPILAGTPVPQPAAAITPDNAAQLTKLALLAPGDGVRMIASPDGRHIALGSMWSGFTVYDATTLKTERFLTVSVHPWYHWVLAPDGQTLAVAINRVLRIWNADGTGRRFEAESDTEFTGLVMSEDGMQLASSNNRARIQIWRVSDGALLHTFNTENSEEVLTFRQNALNGAGLILTTDGSQIRLRQASNGKQVATFNSVGAALSMNGSAVALIGSQGLAIAAADGSETTRMLTTTAHSQNDELGRAVVAISPNGALVAAPLDSDAIGVWRSDGSLMQTLPFNNSVQALVFGPDGTTLIASSLANSTLHKVVQQWNLNDATPLQRIELPEVHLERPIFLDNQHIAAFSKNGDDKTMYATWNLAGTSPAASPMQDVTAPSLYDQATMIAGTTPVLWQPLSGQPLPAGTARAGGAVSPDGTLLATPNGRTLELRSTADNHVVQTLTSPDVEYSVYNATFAPDGRFIAGVISNSQVAVWNVADGTLQTTIQTRSGTITVNRLAFSQQLLAVVLGNGRIRLYDPVQGSEKASVMLPEQAAQDPVIDPRAAAFSPDGNLLAVGTAGMIALIDPNGTIQRTLAHPGAIEALAWNVDGTLLLSGGEDVRVWNAADGTLRHTLVTYDRAHQVGFGPDGTLRATTSAAFWEWQSDGTLAAARRWNIRPDQPHVTVADNGNLLDWNADGTLARTAERTTPVTRVAFSADQQLLALHNDADNSIEIWNTTTLQRSARWQLPKTQQNYNALRWIGNDRLALADYDAVVVLNATQGNELLHLTAAPDDTAGHDQIDDVAATPDGQVVAAVTSDGTLRLWNSTDGKLRLTAPTDSRVGHRLTFSPDGHLLAIGNFQGTLSVWGIRAAKSGA